MRENYTLARLYVEDALAGDIVLDADAAHYLTRVLRLTVGGQVRLFNGRDGEVAADITEIAKKTITLRVVETLRPAYAPPALTVFFAPLKRHRTATVLEKATELGATRLQPVITARTQLPKLKIDKMRAQIVEAAEQTERLDLPDLQDAAGLFEALEDFEDTILMADEDGTAPSIMQAISGAALPLAVLVGPEGGWSPDERARLHAMDRVTPVSLGPRILRADTAVIAMLSIVQAVHGDW